MRLQSTWAGPGRACRPRRISRDEAQSGPGRVRGRCSVCGRLPDEHEVVLIAVHYLREQDSDSILANPRAICTQCSARSEIRDPGEPAWMGAARAHKSVHVRLGETLKAFQPDAVPAATLKLVADQDGWKSRLRELRYLGWDIESFNRKLKGGRVSSFYRLKKSKPWPPHPTGTIRQYERDRAQRNKTRK